MPKLTHLTCSGPPFDIGVQLGRFGADVVHRKLLPSKLWASLQPWKGSAPLQAMRALIEQRFPAVWQELQGLAAGLDLPLDDALLWNCRGDLWAMAPDGCSTVLLPGANPAFAHNEDGAPEFAGHCALVTVDGDEGPVVTSFAYPGSIIGHTFACNACGLAMSVNNIRARYAARHVEAGVPRMVLGRAVLDCRSVAEAQALLQGTPRAGAFHLTLAQPGQRVLTSIEFASAYCSIERVAQPAFHANHAVHAATRDFPQVITASSRSRQLRGDELLAGALQRLSEGSIRPQDLAARILRDEHPAALPIWRQSPTDSDHENTMATAVFKIGPEAVDWEVHEDRAARPAWRLRNARLD